MKIQKNYNLGSSCPFKGKQTFFCKIRFLDIYFFAEFQKKLMNRFWEKLVTDVQMDAQMNTWTSLNLLDPHFHESNDAELGQYGILFNEVLK